MDDLKLMFDIENVEELVKTNPAEAVRVLVKNDCDESFAIKMIAIERDEWEDDSYAKWVDDIAETEPTVKGRCHGYIIRKASLEIKFEFSYLVRTSFFCKNRFFSIELICINPSSETITNHPSPTSVSFLSAICRLPFDQ
jgi:hypothetical protein